MTATTVPFVMSRDGAVGWRDIPLDGMTCYHRCVEAVLRGHGLTRDEIIAEMGGAITDRLGDGGSPYLRLHDTAARWRIAPTGTSYWDEVAARLSAGRPVLIWPDAYFWPGDVFEGRRHRHHHAVLALGVGDGSLRVLDVDADEKDGFVNVVPLTAETKRACTRLLELEVGAPARRSRQADVRSMVAASVRPLSRLATATGELVDWWAAGPTRSLAHSVDLYALGDVQPQVYLFAALCERFGEVALAALGFEAAALAKKISLFLFSLHRYRPVAPYDLCRDDIAALADKLRDMSHTAAELTGSELPEVDESAGEWLWRRLDALSVWHFDRRIDVTRSKV
jgi:hypothetical protein